MTSGCGDDDGQGERARGDGNAPRVGVAGSPIGVGSFDEVEKLIVDQSGNAVPDDEDGLARVRRMISDGPSSIPIGEKLGFALVEADRGRTVIEGAPGRDAYNVLGTVHGGYVATMLDTACGIAVHSAIGCDLAYTTLELKVSYLRALSEGSGVVRATGRVVRLGRRVGFAEAQLHDAAGTLCATASSTLLIMEPSRDAAAGTSPHATASS